MQKKWIRLSVFGLIGMSAGFAYYYYIGCQSGACPITNNPYISMGYGLAAGLLLGWENKKGKKE